MAQCSCCDLPAIAKFVSKLDAVGTSDGRITFESRVHVPTSPPDGKGYVFEPPGYVIRSVRGDRSAVRRFDWTDVHIEVTATREPPDLRPEEVEAIVSVLTQRLDKLLREVLGGI